MAGHQSKLVGPAESHAPPGVSGVLPSKPQGHLVGRGRQVLGRWDRGDCEQK